MPAPTKSRSPTPAAYRMPIRARGIDVSGEGAQVVVIAGLEEGRQASPGLNCFSPPPEEVKAEGRERAEEDVLVAQGPHVLDLVMLVHFPVPHAQVAWQGVGPSFERVRTMKWPKRRVSIVWFNSFQSS
jgi:hypothetical protein